MSTPDTDVSIEDAIYEAAVVPERWPEVLRRFRRLAGCKESVIVAVCGDHVRLTASSPDFEAFATDYFNRFKVGNERLQRLMRRRHAGFVTDLDVFSVDELLREPMFRDWLIPHGYGRGLATVFDMPTGDQVVLHAEGEFRERPICARLVRRLDAIRPHFARAVLVSARIHFEREKTAVETFARMGLPAASISREGRLRLVNPEFEREEVWSAGLRDRIALRDPRANALLRASLARLGRGAIVQSIALVSGGPAVLHVIPVVRSAHDIFTGADALLVMTRRKSSPGPSVSLLEALFDMTAAESVVAAAVAEGKSIDQVARENHRSIETIRTQLKAVLIKTGCHRQTELALLLRALHLPYTCP